MKNVNATASEESNGELAGLAYDASNALLFFQSPIANNSEIMSTIAKSPCSHECPTRVKVYFQTRDIPL